MEKLKVINLPRRVVANSNLIKPILEENSLTSKNTAWITIGEPDINFVPVSQVELLDFPCLQKEFWDVTQIKDYTNFLTGEIEKYLPPTTEDAIEIVDFILKHEGKNIIVNCAAGISRSGAIARFCNEILGYEWPNEFQRVAWPNLLLYNNMVKYYRPN